MIRIAVATLTLAALPAFAAVSDLSSQYATWAGGKANADSLVNGLQSGKSVMLTTQGPNNTRSLAGFTPPAPMPPEDVGAALARARSTLASMGIRQPSADQIQTALIGGEVTLADGQKRSVQGSVTPLPDATATR